MVDERRLGGQRGGYRRAPGLGGLRGSAMRARWGSGGRVAAVAAVALMLTGCGAGGGGQDASTPPSGTGPVDKAQPGPPGSPPPEPPRVELSPEPPAPGPTPPELPPRAPEPSARGDVPTDLAWLPSDEELDQVALDVEAAFVAHWAAYDAAAAAGFADGERLDTLLASAGGETLAGLWLQVEALDGTGRTVDGTSTVLGVEVVALSPPELSPPEEGPPEVGPPEADGHGLGVHIDACVHSRGRLLEPDGTVVREIGAGGPTFVRALLTDQNPGWMLVSQVHQDGPCPEVLREPRD